MPSIDQLIHIFNKLMLYLFRLKKLINFLFIDINYTIHNGWGNLDINVDPISWFNCFFI